MKFEMDRNKKISDRQREKIISNCIELISSGYSFEYCKNRYKKYGAVLEEYFTIIAGLKKLGRDDLSDAFLKKTLNKIYNDSSRQNKYIENSDSTKIKNSRLGTFLKPAVIFAAVVLIFSFSSIGILSASQNSLPANPLYAVKRYGENIKLLVTPESKKKIVHFQFLSNRLKEAELFFNSDDREKDKMESIIEDAEEEFDYCKKYNYFGNYTEQEISDLIKTIKEKSINEFSPENDSGEGLKENTTGTYDNTYENGSDNTGGYEQDDSDASKLDTGEKVEAEDSDIKEDRNNNPEINVNSETDITQGTEGNSETDYSQIREDDKKAD